jgi:hypothetical protein
MGFWFLKIAMLTLMNLGFGSDASARPTNYPQVRFVSPVSEGLGGVVLPLGEEAGNALMNNPAGLARFTGYRSEPLNLSFTANSNVISNIGSTLGNTFSLGGLSSTMNSNANSQFGLGISNMSAFAWNGLAVGFLIQEFSSATSDGTNHKSHAVSQFIPTVGYGFGLARNIIRVGYSLQYVNQVSGDATGTSDTNASFLRGIQKGSGLSHNLSVNFALPFTYLPTISVIARNLGGLHFATGGILPRGSAITGAPGAEQMTVDAAFDFLVRISGTLKTHWFFEFKDFTMKSNISSVFERLSTGLDISLSPNFALRGGMTGIAQFSGGLSYRSPNSEISLAYFNEKSPFSTTAAWDTRYALQYKIMLNQKSKRVDGELQQVGNKR